MMRLAELYAPPIRQKSKASAQNVRVKPLVGEGAAAKSGAFATLEKDADTALHYYKLAAVRPPLAGRFLDAHGFCKVDFVSWRCRCDQLTNLKNLNPKP
jgi:hypothetical protein